MSYPFYCLAATRLTASQHPCRLSIAAAAVAAPFLLINPALAALNCTEQPTCSELGYKKTLEANCEDYILCPFDTNYKACVKEGCGEGFAKDVSGCGESGDKGWIFIKTSGYECGSCSPKNCPNPIERPKNTLSCPIGQCLAETGNYTGDTPCAVCTTLCCKDGYAKTANDCGEQGEKGWKLDMFGTSDGCRRCIANTCDGYNEKFQSASDCGSNGSQGWNLETCYAGDTLMGKCIAKDCPSGYTAENPGTSVSCFANSVMLYKGYSGNNRCYKCQECPNGYAVRDSYCEDGYSINKSISHATYSGCYKCEMKSCTQGYARDADDCGTSGSKGWSLSSETDTAGCKKCVANSCPSETQTTTQCTNGTAEETDSYSGNNICYKCNSCSDGYAISEEQCGSGYTFNTSQRDPKNTSCYKCDAKPCPEGYTTDLTGTCEHGTESNGSSGGKQCLRCKPCAAGYYHTDEYKCKGGGAPYYCYAANPNNPRFEITNGCFKDCYYEDYNSKELIPCGNPIKK